MQPGNYPLTPYRGDTGRWRFTFWEDAAHTTPFDLAGAEVGAEIRDRSGGDRIVELECVVVLPNSVDVTLQAADSAAAPRTGVWDLQATWTGGVVRTLVGGAVKVTGDVTGSTPPGA